MVANLLRRIGIGIAVVGCIGASLVWAFTPLPLWTVFAIAVVFALTGFNIASIPNLPDGWFQQTIRTGKDVPAPGSRYGVRIRETEEEKIDPDLLKNELRELGSQIDRNRY